MFAAASWIPRAGTQHHRAEVVIGASAASAYGFPSSADIVMVSILLSSLSFKYIIPFLCIYNNRSSRISILDIGRASPELGASLNVVTALTRHRCGLPVVLPVRASAERLVAGVHQMTVVVVDGEYGNVDWERAEKESHRPAPSPSSRVPPSARFRVDAAQPSAFSSVARRT